MKKSDLKNGMVIKNKKRERGIILNDYVITEKRFNALREYREDLTHTYCTDCDIEKVYEIDTPCLLRDTLRNLIKIWERAREIDWTKVPKWTKVQVKFPGETEWENYLFTDYLPNNDFKFYVAGFKDDEFTGYEATRHSVEYCRIHESVEINEEWYK